MRMLPCSLVRRSVATVAVATIVAGARPATAAAQGRTAAPLLGMPASARAAALGDAYGAAHEAGRIDAASLFYNPAQLAGAAGTSASISVERYIASATVGSLAVSSNVRGFAVGIGLLALDYPDADEIVPDASGDTGTPTGRRIGAHDVVAGVAIAAGSARARAGAMLEYVHQSLPGASGGSAAVSVGGAGRVASGSWGRLDVTAAVQHLGGDVQTASTAASLPRNWRAGTALEAASFMHARWLVLGELVGPRGVPVTPRAGIEGSWELPGVALAGRAGWAAQSDDAIVDPLTLGAGLRRGTLWLDYAWRQFGALGSTHRFGVRWSR